MQCTRRSPPLQRSAHDSVDAPAADIVEWVGHWNEDPKPFVCRKTADEILERLGRYCAVITTTEFNGETEAGAFAPS